MAYFDDLADYLKPGYPQTGANVGRTGSTYVYVGAVGTLTATATEDIIGLAWADGRTVENANWQPFPDFSGNGELIVSTGAYAVPAFGTTLEKSYTELNWHPVERPLETNPDFLASGTYDLATPGSDSVAPWQHILGWRMEQDASLKALFKYKLVVGGRVSSTIVTIPSGSALHYLKLIRAGQETFVDYFPVWAKYSIYTGSEPPAAGVIGQKTTTPSGAPSTNALGVAFEWVKDGDHVVQQGVTMRWRRTETWTGYTKVYADSAHVYPPA